MFVAVVDVVVVIDVEKRVKVFAVKTMAVIAFMTTALVHVIANSGSKLF